MPSASLAKLGGIQTAVALPKVDWRYPYPGRRRLADREAVQRILFVLHTGCLGRTCRASLVWPAAIPRTAPGLGRYRWVVERTFAWLRQFERPLVRYDRRADIHEALLAVGCYRPTQ